jgi:hypothetical protein
MSWRRADKSVPRKHARSVSFMLKANKLRTASVNQCARGTPPQTTARLPPSDRSDTATTTATATAMARSAHMRRPTHSTDVGP